MNDGTAERMDPVSIPAEFDITIEFRGGEIKLDITDPEGTPLAASRIELAMALGATIMSIGHDAAAQDLEEE